MKYKANRFSQIVVLTVVIFLFLNSISAQAAGSNNIGYGNNMVEAIHSPILGTFAAVRPEMFIPFAGIAMSIGVVWIVFFFIYKTNRSRHETIQAMVDKGMEIPPELLLVHRRRRSAEPVYDLRKGLIWLALGFGIGITIFGISGNSRHLYLGLLPCFIGGGYLILAKLDVRGSKQNTTNNLETPGLEESKHPDDLSPR